MEASISDMHLWRMIFSVSWSILVQIILLCTYIIITNIDLWNWDIFNASVKSLFSVKSLYVIPLAGVVFFQGIICSRDYLKPPQAQFINRRFLLLVNIFSYHNLAALLIYMSLGLSLSYVYASLSNASISLISVDCSGDYNINFSGNSCLNERKLFLVLGGIWIGFISFIKDYIYNSKTLIFPPVQQRKFIQVKTVLFPYLKDSVIKAIFPSLLFCFFYYFKGNSIRSYFCSFSGLSLPKNLLDTLYILLDFELMFYLLLFTSLYLFTLNVMVILFNINLTERAYFPVTTYMLPSTTNNTILLRDALSAENIPIIQHLGFLDLALLSQFDSHRRAELFILSQPGGHAHTWNAIVNECSKVIDKFTVNLDACINVSHVETINKKPTEKLDSSSHAWHQRSYNMRNLSTNQNVEYVSPTVALQKSYERLIKVYQEWVNKKLDSFCKKPVIAYFFGEMSEPKIKHLLFQSQSVIWAVESLSFLICSSLKEDSFGIAQSNLSDIIVSLLHLKNSLDKLQKQSVFIKKSNKLDVVDIQMKNALKFSVKQSIFRIAITFKDYIKEINLTTSECTQMMNFIEFKEV